MSDRDTFTLEKLKISEKLDAMRDTQIVISSKVDAIETKTSEMRDILIGNGSKDRPGLILDVDRLKQAYEKADVHRGIIYTALASLGIAQLWHHLFH